MDEVAIHQFVRDLIRTPPSLLFGHAHSLFLLASFINARCPNATIRPNAIISTCMVLHDFERQAIEHAFACRVTNRYGCEEVSLIACECERHEGLHVNADCVIVELINERGEPCPTGTPGRVVVTDLINRAMPMVRYEVGDMAIWSHRPCSCGRTLPLLERIEGRVADYVVTASGTYISGISLTENFAVQIPGIAQLQIIQEAIDEFTFNIVRGYDFGQLSEETLTLLVQQRFGPTAQFTCRFVDRILPEPSGKFRFCISHVTKSFG
jgi:phenylacetate-CoA ligase